MPLRIRPDLDDLPVYVPGKTFPGAVKLASNEVTDGPLPSVRDAIATAAAGVNRYPDNGMVELTAALAKKLGVTEAEVQVGCGSVILCQNLITVTSGPGDEVMFGWRSFETYPLATRVAGATPVGVPLTSDLTYDLPAMAAAITDRTRLIFVCNPNNPTGTMIPITEVARLAEAIPDQVILVLDGAYVEFAEDYDGGAKLVETRDNVVMTRTFSKIHGLGGLRIGWGYGPRAIIDVLNRVRQPFNLSSTQLSVAEAAIRDEGFTEHCRAENARLRGWLRDKLLGLGIACDESHANYVLARFADEAEAGACDGALRAEGILVRRVGGYGLPQALRITVGDEAGCTRVIDAIARFKGAA